MTYVIVFRRDSVIIMFLVADLNDLKILVGDIQNAYLNALTKEKVFFYSGYECNLGQGRLVFVFRYLYVLK